MDSHSSEWITISLDEYESMKRTIEILSNADLMDQINNGMRKESTSRDFEELGI
jgi:PHD/YefM family antitoxin component YafN of YafNO toxin-antitoxin module